MNNVKVWLMGELLAQKYLKKIGYKIIDTNIKIANTEVDIIAICPKRLLLKSLKVQYKSGKLIKTSYLAEKRNTFNTLVFVEVKARSGEEYGTPAEAVNKIKQQKIQKFSQSYIKNSKYTNMPIRFDIVSVLNEKIEHIVNAF